MENFVDKAICPEGKIISPDGPFDVCIECSRRAVACSGPRTTAMDPDQYLAWMRRLFEKWGGTRQEFADRTGTSKSTVDDFFAGRRKDISRQTAGRFEDVLIGGDGKWPCALLVDHEKEIVYEDRPETIEALRVNMEANQQKDAKIAELRARIADMREAHEKELQSARSYYQSDVQEYKDLVAHMREQMSRKDDYIDRLARKAGI